jgi:hypothetical protein
MNINQQYMHMLRFDIVRCVVLLMKHIILYADNSDAIKLPKSYPSLPPSPPVVGRDYRLSNFRLAKEDNKELKKKFLH